MKWDDVVVDAAVTDTGMRRMNNQDSFAIVRAKHPEAWKQRGHVFVVADGMGAHAVGELASKMACDSIPHQYLKIRNATPAEALTKAYLDVGTQIHSKASANTDFRGMGTTCSTLVLLPQGAIIAHVGDSRVYRVRGEQIDQLSFDHSLAWELNRLNQVSPESKTKSIPKNVITRSLGPDPKVEIDIEGPMQVQTCDVFILCSDGLSGQVSDSEIGAFASHFHPDDAARFLMALANLRGGPDNITVIVVRVGDWREPGAVVGGGAAVRSESSGGLGGLLKRLFARGRADKTEAVVENRYRTESCALTEPFLDSLLELIQKAQKYAADQSWPADWAGLSTHRQRAEADRAEGRLRDALKSVGEAAVLLSGAGRLHRKAALRASID